MSVITRFAPSPTGMLHIGSVRTAIFSYLYAKQHNGKFLLRIEDTDKERSTQQAVDVILKGMRLLGLNWDGDEVYQSKNEEKHRDFAIDLVNRGLAYYAFDTKEELEEMRLVAQSQSKAFVYRANPDSLKERKDVKPVVRLNVKAVCKEKIIVNDIVKGNVEFDADNIEDFVILRSDLTPTYMLAVVVDDINMNVTHIIRGDDHLTNTPKQILLYMACGERVPYFAHIPLIHDSKGQKLSKRKGAAAVEEYIAMGFLPDALLNYLVKLGWSCGEKEYFSKEEMIKLFDLSKVSLSPARFDIDKLLNINLFYISRLSGEGLIEKLKPSLEKHINRKLTNIEIERLLKISSELKKNKNLVDIELMSKAYLESDFVYSQNAIDLINHKKDIISKLYNYFSNISQSANHDFKTLFNDFLTNEGLSFKDVGPVFRSCLIGDTTSTALGEIFNAFGLTEVVKRLNLAISL